MDRSHTGYLTLSGRLTDALGNLVRFVLLPGHRYDTIGVAPLIDGVAFGGLIADMAFDSNAIVAELNQRGAKVVIAQHPRRTLPLQIDLDLYKWRHLIENFFGKLKEFKRIAMRACAPTRPTQASQRQSISPLPSYILDESQQTLVVCQVPCPCPRLLLRLRQYPAALAALPCTWPSRLASYPGMPPQLRRKDEATDS